MLDLPLHRHIGGSLKRVALRGIPVVLAATMAALWVLNIIPISRSSQSAPGFYRSGNTVTLFSNDVFVKTGDSAASAVTDGLDAAGARFIGYRDPRARSIGTINQGDSLVVDSKSGNPGDPTVYTTKALVDSIAPTPVLQTLNSFTLQNSGSAAAEPTLTQEPLLCTNNGYDNNNPFTYTGWHAYAYINSGNIPSATSGFDIKAKLKGYLYIEVVDTVTGTAYQSNVVRDFTTSTFSPGSTPVSATVPALSARVFQVHVYGWASSTTATDLNPKIVVKPTISLNNYTNYFYLNSDGTSGGLGFHLSHYRYRTNPAPPVPGNLTDLMQPSQYCFGQKYSQAIDPCFNGSGGSWGGDPDGGGPPGKLHGGGIGFASCAIQPDGSMGNTARYLFIAESRVANTYSIHRRFYITATDTVQIGDTTNTPRGRIIAYGYPPYSYGPLNPTDPYEGQQNGSSGGGSFHFSGGGADTGKPAGGGGHGGKGGHGVALISTNGNFGIGGVVTEFQPLEPLWHGGSGGMYGGGSGGGTIVLQAVIFKLYGTIDVAGSDGTEALAGAGAGGTVRIVAGSMDDGSLTEGGSGVILAQGGKGQCNANYCGGGGGGGIVHLSVAQALTQAQQNALYGRINIAGGKTNNTGNQDVGSLIISQGEHGYAFIISASGGIGYSFTQEVIKINGQVVSDGNVTVRTGDTVTMHVEIISPAGKALTLKLDNSQTYFTAAASTDNANGLTLAGDCPTSGACGGGGNDPLTLTINAGIGTSSFDLTRTVK